MRKVRNKINDYTVVRNHDVLINNNRVNFVEYYIGESFVYLNLLVPKRVLSHEFL